MSFVSSEDPCSPFVRHDGTDVDTSQAPQRHNTRWGEIEVRDNGRDCLHSDGLSRFRTNFDCCHQVNEGGQLSGFEGQMLPKPFQENVNAHIISQQNIKRRVNSKSRYEVFPQQDSARKDFAGDFVLGDNTRDAIQSFHNKLHRSSPRYGGGYGGQTANVVQSQSDILEHRDKRDFNEAQYFDVPLKRVRFADDIGQPLDTRTYPRADLDFLSNPVNWPSFDGEAEEQKNAYLTSYNIIADDKLFEEGDENQNFQNLLLSEVYHYRLPSTFHYDQFHKRESKPDSLYGNAANNFMSHDPNVATTSVFPSRLAEMEAIQMDLQNKERHLEGFRGQQMFPRCISPGVDDWVNSSEQLKLKLNHKALTQKMYHGLHPECVPDLRDFKTYSKRVFFQGYNSSVFRG